MSISISPPRNAVLSPDLSFPRAMRAMLCALVLAAMAGSQLLPPPNVEELRASVGGFAVMNCHLDFPFGNEIPYHLQWDKDGEPIFSWYSGDAAPVLAERWGGRVRRVGGAGGVSGLGGGSINVSAVRETDAGLYRCRVSFPNRTPPARNNGTFYRLHVEGGNLITTPPMNVTVLEGERAELECEPKNEEWEVQWFKDGKPLEELPELAARVERPPNGSLVLPRATSIDVGEFACRVMAPHAHENSASAFLDVQYKAKVTYAPRERFLPAGKPASLDCHFSANPPLTNLRWEKDGFLFDPYNVPGVFYSRNGSLLFNQVEESHEGEYSCTPYNALGSEGASPGVRVRVARPPQWGARPLPLYVARLGATLTLPCAPRAHNSPLPVSVNWTRKDGQPLPPGRHSTDGGNLTLSSLAAEDGGVYVCAVANAAAALSTETELLIENAPPRAPHNLTAVIKQDSLHLSWLPGHGGGGGGSGAAVDYTVWYRERATSEWRTMKILSRGVTDATLVGLRPGAEYELRVLQQDHLGDGLFSRPLFVRTLPTDPESNEATETVVGVETTERASEVGEAKAVGVGAGIEDEDEEMSVSARLLDEGALVRWRRRAGDESRCALSWFAGDPPGDPTTLIFRAQTLHDYALVGEVEEDTLYWARVECASGAAGGAALRVPAYGRLRAVAAGAAAAALLLAALAAAVVLARRRLRLRRPPPPAPPAPPPRADKRRL